MAENNTYIKQEFENGEILNAEHLNHIEDAIEEIYNILNAAPVLSYVTDTPGFGPTDKKYWSIGERMNLVFNFQTAAAGKVTVTILRNGLAYKTITTNKGRISIDLGIANETKTYIYTVSAVDALGREPEGVTSLTFTHILGGVTISSNFSDLIKDRAIVVSDNEQLLNVTYSFNYADTTSGTRKLIYKILKDTNIIANDEITIEGNPSGVPIIEDGIPVTFSTTGKYTFILKAVLILSEDEVLESNELIYNFNVVNNNEAIATILNENIGDTNNINSILFLTTSSWASNIELVAKCSLNKTKHYYYTVSRGQEQPWTIGKLDAGDYNYTITIYPNDSTPTLTTPVISGNFTITQGTSLGDNYTTRNLLAYFEADGKSNAVEEDKQRWTKKAGSNDLYFELNNLNYITNGWQEYITGKDEENQDIKSTFLSLNGEAYGKLCDKNGNGYNPYTLLSQSSNQGMAIEILFKSRNVGNFAGKVMSSQNNPTKGGITYNGINIGYDEVVLSTRNANIQTSLIEEKYNHIVLVIDKYTTNRDQLDTEEDIENYNPVPSMRIYINGVLTKADSIKLSDLTSSADTPILPLILNSNPTIGGINSNGFGSCEIKLVRLYDSYLTSMEVYANYLNSQFDNTSKQTIQNRNSLDKTDIPVIYFVKNRTPAINSTYNTTFSRLNSITDKGESKKYYVNCTMYYKYYKEGESLQTQEKYSDVDVYLQGTSSLLYPVKNYKIKNYGIKESKRSKINFIPPSKDDTNWIADSTYTLKCDYMEQSHKNNTPTAKFYDSVLETVINSGEVAYNQAISPALAAAAPAGEGKAKYRDTIDGFACILYYNENNGTEDLNNTINYETNSADHYAGTFMFNIDKSGKGLGFEIDGYECVSYEGGSNNNISAATFYDWEYYDEKTTASSDKAANKYAYYTSTMEPRHNVFEHDDIDLKTENEDSINTYEPLERNIEWLKNFTRLIEDSSKPLTAEEKTSLINRFRKEFSTYFSYEYCLAYFLQMMLFAQIDNVGKNAMFDCWRLKGGKWGPLYPRPYDMDSQMGENNSGEDIILTSAEISPVFSPATTLDYYDDITSPGNKTLHKRYKQYNVTQSRLWTTFALCFANEIQVMYKILRENVYTTSNICNFVENITSKVIGERFYNRDASSKYLSQLNVAQNAFDSDIIYKLQGNRDNRYRQFLTERIDFLDSYFNNRTGTPVQDGEVSRATNLNSPILIRSNAAAPAGQPIAEIKVGISTYSPVYIAINIDQKDRQILYVDQNSTHVPTGSTNVVEGTEFSIPVEGNDKNIYIYGAGNIKGFNKMEDLKLTSISLNNATKITEFSTTNSIYLQSIGLRDNPYLTSINLAGCTALTTLTLSDKLTNIKTINLDNTTSLQTGLEINGTNLKTFSANNSKIPTLNLSNNVNFNSLNIDNCNFLTNLTLNNCDNFIELSFINLNRLSNLTITNCNLLEKLELPNISGLTNLTLQNNPNLSELNLSYSSGLLFNDLNLALLTGLKKLNLEQTQATIGEGVGQDGTIKLKLPYIKGTVENATWEGLIYLNAAKSGLKTIGYGQNSSATTLDLSGIQSKKDDFGYYMTENNCELYLKGNKAVEIITNLQYHNNNLSELFKECSALRKITGELSTLGHVLNSVFYQATSLEDINELNLIAPNVTTATSLFYQAYSITKNSGTKEFINSIPKAENLSSCYMMYNQGKLDFDETYLSDFFNDGTSKKRPIKNLTYFFYGSKITNLPSSFLASVDNTVTDITAMCQSCGDLSTVGDWLSMQTNLTTIRSLYNGCSKLPLSTAIKTIPSNNKITNASETFKYVGTTATVDQVTLKTLFNKLTKVTDIDQIFNSSKGLTTLPDKLFAPCSNLQRMVGAFANITNGLTISNFMFENNTNLTNFAGVFEKTVIHNEALTADFFTGASNIINIGSSSSPNYGSSNTIFYGAFKGSKLKVISTKLLAPLTNLQKVDYCFMGVPEYENSMKFVDDNLNINSNMPVTFFENNIKLTNLDYCFAYNYSLTGFIDRDGKETSDLSTFFYRDKNGINNLITNLSGLFEYCTKLTGDVHNTLFKNLKKLNSIYQVFQNSGVTGQINSDMFKGCSSLTNTSRAFYNCQNLGYFANGTSTTQGISPALFDSCRNTLQTTAEMFRNCYKFNQTLLYDPAKGLFTDCKALQSVNSMFRNCYCLKGKIPANMFSMTNPNDIFNSLTDISYLFSGCGALTTSFGNGAIGNGYLIEGIDYLVPPDWLKHCWNLNKIEYLFNSVGYYPAYDKNKEDITGEYNMAIEKDTNDQKILTIPVNLFSNQLNIANASYAFNCMPNAEITLDKTFMENSLNTLTNIERIFFNTKIKSLGDSSGNIAFDPGVTNEVENYNNVLTNMKYAFAVITNNSNKISGGYAPKPNRLPKANKEGILANQTNPSFMKGLYDDYPGQNIYVTFNDNKYSYLSPYGDYGLGTTNGLEYP